MLPAQDLKLAEILLAEKAINEKQYERLKLENVRSGKTVEQLAIDNRFASLKVLCKAKAKLYGIPFVDLKGVGFNPVVLSLVPKAVALRYNIFPFSFDRTKTQLLVAMADPLDLPTVEFLAKKTGRQITPCFATKLDIKEAIDQKYSQSLSSEVTEALKDSETPEKAKIIDAGTVGEVIREAPIAKIVVTLLEFAIKSRASDVHIEPLEDKTRVRYRIDGILQEKLILPRSVHEAVISRIKILAGLKIDEKRIPQDGRFSFRSDNEIVDLRVSSLPSIYGEKIVLRLLKKNINVPSLTDLGLRGLALKSLERSILIPHGIVLITGPTGSGKTTTLYSILSKINTTKINIVTVEDPVEYEIPGVSQVQVNPAAGLTFASGLRSFLRQDPDIIMVGEIRDEETADLAIQASLTGHLVFATLHTNDAAGALPRLLDMKMEPYLLASSMTCVVAQRVVRKTCPKCKLAFLPSAEVGENIKRTLGNLYQPKAQLKLYKGKGCAYCNQTGYFGRVGIFEVLPISEKISKLILEQASSSAIEKQAIEEGMVTMIQDGYSKVLEGITTIEEVLRVAEI